MCDELKPTGISKRNFLKHCALGLCGIALLTDRSEALMRTLTHENAASDQLWKWSKEAEFYSRSQNGVQCHKCPNHCALKEGESGFCRNRQVYNGKLYSISYGNPCAVHIDPVEKKPFYHFLPTTRAYSIAAAGCNLRCLNCQNWQISQFSPKETTNDDLMPDKAVEQCLANRCESIAYTYSEPTTFYEYTYDTAKIARTHKIKNLLKSNGYINEAPLRKLAKVLDGANIDLKNFDDAVYQKLSHAKLDTVLRTLKALKEEGVWLEITNLVIPSWTDNLDMIRRMCEWLVKNGLQDCPLHFTRFTPLYKLNQLPMTPVGTLDKARDIALKSGMKYPYIGNVPGHAAENTFCAKCKKMLIERKGFAILKNDIVKGKCRHCGEKIPGVWG